MPRYIDAEELTEHKFSSVTHERFVSDGRPKSKKEIYAYKVGHNDAIDSIVNFAPTADVVPVVRCRDCKKHDWCSIEDMALNDETFFCKWGERREE